MDFPKEIILNKPLIFDSHAHYDDKKFDDIRDDLLSSLPKIGVENVITCSVDAKSSLSSMRLCEQYGYIYFAAGIHPENLDGVNNIDEIEAFLSHQKCVAVGEIGLDYYFKSDNKNEQISVFKRQTELALRHDMPIIVHDRDAHEDTLNILKEYKPKGVVHCFSGSAEMAKEILGIGMYIGVGGVVTFKNARKLPEVLAVLPPDRMLVETDCPYLAPEPYRGKLCHSGYIALTAQKIAEIKGTTRDEILTLTNKNAKKLFSL